MRDIALGQYYPANSPVHRLDPRIKLIAVIIYIVAIFYIRAFVVYGFALLSLLAVIFLSKVPLGKVLKSLKLIIFLIIFTVLMSVFFYGGGGRVLWQWGVIKIYYEALLNAAKMTLRLVLLVLGPTMLTFTTTPVELTDGLESLLKPLSYIRFPVHELAIIMSIALRLIPTLVEDTDKIQNAQKARCADFESGNIFKRAKAMLPVLIPLFVSSFRRADELAYAMDSRCYRGAKGRTRMKTLKFHWRDLIAFLFICLFLFVILVLRYNYFPWFFDIDAVWWLVL